MRHHQAGDIVLQAARSSDDPAGSAAISTEVEQCSQTTSVKLDVSTIAGSAHHGHSEVTI
jgi:hypothetical protein